MRNANAYEEAKFQGRLWSPNVLRLALWLDADDQSTITIVTGVSEWRDKSGNGRHASNSTGSTQPAYGATGLNGRPALVFPASANGRWLRTPVYSWATDRKFANFAVASVSSAAGFSRLLITQPAVGFNIGVDYQFGYLGLNSAGTGAIAIAGTTATDTPVAPGFSIAGGPRVITNVFGTGGVGNNVNAISLDGGTLISRANCTGDLATNGTTVGEQAGDIYSWRGAIAEIVQVSGEISAALRQTIEGYLAWKWGISLDASHPFRNRPPLIGD